MHPNTRRWLTFGFFPHTTARREFYSPLSPSYRHSVSHIGSRRNGRFGPVHVRQSRMWDHRTCWLDKSPIHPFCYTILLRWICGTVNSCLIPSYTRHHCPFPEFLSTRGRRWLSQLQTVWIYQTLLTLLVFHKIHRTTPSLVIGKRDEIFCSTNRFSMHWIADDTVHHL